MTGKYVSIYREGVEIMTLPEQDAKEFLKSLKTLRIGDKYTKGEAISEEAIEDIRETVASGRSGAFLDITTRLNS